MIENRSDQFNTNSNFLLMPNYPDACRYFLMGRCSTPDFNLFLFLMIY